MKMLDKSPYKFSFTFEENFSPDAATKWMSDRWHTSFYYSLLYIFVIFGIRCLMNNSKPYSLTKALLIWNFFLSAFSIFAFFRTVPEFHYALTRHGFHYSVCEPSNILNNKVSSFWTFLFVLSKLLEFGDTIFIVLRKRPLIFLHWYHHVFTLLYTWYSFKEITPHFRWFVVFNCFIHSLMYSYYAIKAAKMRVPISLSMLLTFLQICQMIAGCLINFTLWYYKLSNIPCSISENNLAVCSLINLSYLVLFIRFFYKTYLSEKKKVKFA